MTSGVDYISSIMSPVILHRDCHVNVLVVTCQQARLVKIKLAQASSVDFHMCGMCWIYFHCAKVKNSDAIETYSVLQMASFN